MIVLCSAVIVSAPLFTFYCLVLRVVYSKLFSCQFDKIHKMVHMARSTFNRTMQWRYQSRTISVLWNRIWNNVEEGKTNEMNSIPLIREHIWNSSIQVIFSFSLSLFFGRCIPLFTSFVYLRMLFSPDFFIGWIVPLLPFFRFNNNQNIYLRIIHRSIEGKRANAMKTNTQNKSKSHTDDSETNKRQSVFFFAADSIKNRSNILCHLFAVLWKWRYFFARSFK